jgi:hypothetical protein
MERFLVEMGKINKQEKGRKKNKNRGERQKNSENQVTLFR